MTLSNTSVQAVRKAGLHIIGCTPAIEQQMKAIPWRAVKSLDNSAPLAVAADAGVPIRILRLYGIEQMDPVTAAQRWLQQDLSHTTHLQLCCESARGYDPAWQREVIAAVDAGGYGGRYLVGNFATGNPDHVDHRNGYVHFPQLEPLYDLLRMPRVDLGLDEYTGILPSNPEWSQWVPWTVLRHRLIIADLAHQGIEPDVYILESGVDNVKPVVSGHGGWIEAGYTAEQMAALMAYLDEQDASDHHVQCRCYFTSGPTPDWVHYDMSAPDDVYIAQVTQKGQKVFLVQAGHLNIENNCNTGLRGETGAPGRRGSAPRAAPGRALPTSFLRKPPPASRRAD